MQFKYAMDSTIPSSQDDIQASQMDPPQDQPSQSSGKKNKMYGIVATVFLLTIALIGVFYFFQKGLFFEKKNQSLITKESAQVTETCPSEGTIAFERKGEVFLYDFKTQQEKKITPEDDGEYRVGDWSPDGSVLFISKHPEDLYLYNFANGQLTPFALGLGPGASGKWSPNGQYIAVDTGTYITRGLQFFAAEGTKLGDGYTIMGGQWSPDSIHYAANVIVHNSRREVLQPSLNLITIDQTSTIARVLKDAGTQYGYYAIGWKSNNEIVYLERKYIQPIPDLNDNNYEEVMRIGRDYTETYWNIALDGQVTSLSEEEALQYSPYQQENMLGESLPKEIVGSLAPVIEISPDGQWITFNGGKYPDQAIYIAGIAHPENPTKLLPGLHAHWQPEKK